MIRSKQILEELESLSPLVATLPVETPYGVPSAYFVNLPAILLAKVSGLDQYNDNDSNLLPVLDTPYKLPIGYFDQLPGLVLARIKSEELSSNQELESLSPLLLQLRTAPTFRMPDEYFTELPETVLSQVERSPEEELQILSATLNQLKHRTTFKIPQDYFNALPQSILQRVAPEYAFNDEDVMPSILVGLKDNITFRAPEGYFEELPNLMLKRIGEQDQTDDRDEIEILSPLLGKLKKTSPFNLPEGYFEEFPSDITAGVRAVDYVNQELESHPPVMNDLKIQNIYEVPVGYFDNLETKVLTSVKQQKRATVIFGRFNKKIIGIAAAALVAGVMSIAAWSFFYSKPASNAGGDVVEIHKFSNDEIINYLEATPASPVENEAEASETTIKDEDAKDLLADVPDEALQQYLEEHTVSKDLIIN